MKLHHLALVAFALSSPVCLADDWPNWRGPRHDGISLETNRSGKLGKIEWSTNVGVGFSTVSVVGDRLYTQGHEGKSGSNESIYCLDTETGKVVWSDSFEAKLVDYLHEGGPCATPTVHKDKVYAVAKDGPVTCYNARTGERVWRVDLRDLGRMRVPEWGFTASPFILDDWVIIEADCTFALEQATGKVVWQSRDYQPGYGSPVLMTHAGKRYLVTLKNDGLVILDATNGKTVAFEQWKTRFRTNSTTPIVVGSQIFLSTGYNRGCALFSFDGASIRKVYETKTMSNHMNNSVLINGYLYGFDGNTHMRGAKDLVCIEWKTGKEHWRIDDFRIGSITAVGDTLIVLGESGELATAKASPTGFNAIARKRVLNGRCWTVPVLANGRIYCRNAKGDLVCVDAVSSN